MKQCDDCGHPEHGKQWCRGEGFCVCRLADQMVANLKAASRSSTPLFDHLLREVGPKA